MRKRWDESSSTRVTAIQPANATAACPKEDRPGAAPSARVRLERDHDDDRHRESDRASAPRGRRQGSRNRAAVGDLPEKTRYPTATAFSAAMSTRRPRCPSRALPSDRRVEATSTAASIAVFTSSATRTNVIATSSSISSILETPNASAETRTPAANVKWIRGSAVSKRVDDALGCVVEAVEDRRAALRARCMLACRAPSPHLGPWS